MVSLDDQIEAMQRRWPDIPIVTREGRRVVWEGTLEPVKRRYRIRISFRLPYAVENVTSILVQPLVQVLSPILERHPEFEDGPIPHVYVNQDEPELPFLCLFDAYNGEWSLSDLLSETTVPWTARYLYFYEGWLLTGKWRGGGRHPSQAERSGGGRAKAAA